MATNINIQLVYILSYINHEHFVDLILLDDADLVNSPPALSRCVTDSPSNYFLRGGHHRWSSTPLLKAPSRSLSIPVSCTPLAKLPGTLTYSPPKASSTPETNGNKGNLNLEKKFKESKYSA